MEFARRVHANHLRKYTNNPYTDHLAEVAGIVATIGDQPWPHHRVESGTMVAVAWLHDCIEDQGVTEKELAAEFNPVVAWGVMLLSDLETGNRAERKLASRQRLAKAPGWVQTIKVADLISNTSSIVQHDPKFAATYLEEKRLMLNSLLHADPQLAAVAWHQLNQAQQSLEKAAA